MESLVFTKNNNNNNKFYNRSKSGKWYELTEDLQKRYNAFGRE